jgi:hypothetical protein
MMAARRRPVESVDLLSTPFEPDSLIGLVKEPLGPRIPEKIERVVRGFDREW